MAKNKTVKYIDIRINAKTGKVVTKNVHFGGEQIKDVAIMMTQESAVVRIYYKD